MTDDLDLSGEQDVTERMTEQDERYGPDEAENHREPTEDGSMTTEDFDVEEAIDRL